MNKHISPKKVHLQKIISNPEKLCELFQNIKHVNKSISCKYLGLQNNINHKLIFNIKRPCSKSGIRRIFLDLTRGYVSGDIEEAVFKTIKIDKEIFTVEGSGDLTSTDLDVGGKFNFTNKVNILNKKNKNILNISGVISYDDDFIPYYIPVPQYMQKV